MFKFAHFLHQNGSLLYFKVFNKFAKSSEKNIMHVTMQNNQKDQSDIFRITHYFITTKYLSISST